MITDVWFYPAALVATFLIGMSKSGFLPGISSLGVPLMALWVSPVQAAAIQLPLLIVTDWIGIWNYRKSYDWANLRILIPSAFVGAALGAISVANAQQRVGTPQITAPPLPTDPRTYQEGLDQRGISGYAGAVSVEPGQTIDIMVSTKSAKFKADLVRITGVDRSTLADMLARMDRREWISRAGSPTDKRANAVRLAAAGEQMLQNATRNAKAADAAILDALPRAKRKTFLNILGKLAKLSDEIAAKAEKAASVSVAAIAPHEIFFSLAVIGSDVSGKRGCATAGKLAGRTPKRKPARCAASAAISRAGRCRPRGDHDAGQYQRIADEMKRSQPFAEQQDGHRRTEYRHQMEEGCRAVRPDQRHAAVEEEIGECRGEDQYVAQRGQRQRIELQPRARCEFPGRERHQHQCAAAGGEGYEGQLVRFRPARDQRRIEPERNQRACKHHVALVEGDAGECREIAAQDDGEDAGERNRNAGELGPGQSHAEQDQRPQRHRAQKCISLEKHAWVVLS